MDETLSVPEAAARVSDLNLLPVTQSRLLRSAARGEIPALMVGKRLRIRKTDIEGISSFFMRTDASRAVAARLTHERSVRRIQRLAQAAGI